MGAYEKRKTTVRAKLSFFVKVTFGMGIETKNEAGGRKCTNKSKSSNNGEKIWKCVVRIWALLVVMEKIWTLDSFTHMFFSYNPVLQHSWNLVGYYFRLSTTQLKRIKNLNHYVAMMVQILEYSLMEIIQSHNRSNQLVLRSINFMYLMLDEVYRFLVVKKFSQNPSILPSVQSDLQR